MADNITNTVLAGVDRVLTDRRIGHADPRDAYRFEDPANARIATFQRRHGLRADGEPGLATRNMLRAALWEREAGDTPSSEFHLREAAGFISPAYPADDRLTKRALGRLGYLDAAAAADPDSVPYGPYLSAIATFQDDHQERPSAIIRSNSSAEATTQRLLRPIAAAEKLQQVA